ncbi:hypothetical protein B4U79_01612 [Dinothrombium tinctorium]|uniref:C2H2-type domain-containing protein n=1 Tax=Dinothrombium tinctorium TaxID=1965070 RepID=A0A443QVU5_9ACAR|nr:hypothetical protein B4U79_01612 [Dinothrombium tinctorium]
MSKSGSRLDSLDLQLFCEWNECETPAFDDLALFLSHIKSHCDSMHLVSADDSNETPLGCCWNGCNEDEFSDKLQLYLHISYHGFHTKLMSRGSALIKRISRIVQKEVQCYMDNSTRTVLPQLPSAFVCGWQECHAEFNDAESFYRHVETHPFDIPIPSLSKEALRESRFAKCKWDNCQSGFDTRSHLKEHLKSHSQEKVIACPNCGAMFCAVTKFCDHLLRQLDMEEKKIESITVQVTTDDDNQQYTVTLHVEAPSSTEAEVVQSEVDEAQIPKCQNQWVAIGKFQCKECSREFSTLTLLREHSRTHFRQFVCEICGLATDSPSSLKHHKLYRHSDERPFACQFCDSKFKTRSDLRKHIDIHSEDNPFKCNMCAFECRCCHTLAKHQKQEHQSINNIYICDKCKKKFTRGNNLTRHLIKLHKLALKPGQSRFSYSRQADGFFHLDGDE